MRLHDALRQIHKYVNKYNTLWRVGAAQIQNLKPNLSFLNISMRDSVMTRKHAKRTIDYSPVVVVWLEIEKLNLVWFFAAEDLVHAHQLTV